MAKKLGNNVKAAIAEIVKEPVGKAFGGKSADVDDFVEALETLGKKVDAINPTKVTKLVWAVIHDAEGTSPKKKANKEPEPEEDDDDEYEDWTRKELKKLSNADLKDAADDMDVDVPKRLTKKARAELIDEILEAQDEDEEDDDEYETYTEDELKDLSRSDLYDILVDDLEYSKSAAGRIKTKPTKLRAKILELQEELYGDDEDEEDDDDEYEPWTRRDLNEMSHKKLLDLATDEWELPMTGNQMQTLIKKKDKRATIERVLNAQKKYMGEEPDDESDIWEDSDMFTEDELDEMSPKELKVLAKEYGVKPSKKKAKTIEDIMEAQKELVDETNDIMEAVAKKIKKKTK